MTIRVIALPQGKVRAEVRALPMQDYGALISGYDPHEVLVWVNGQPYQAGNALRKGDALALMDMMVDEAIEQFNQAH